VSFARARLQVVPVTVVGALAAFLVALSLVVVTPGVSEAAPTLAQAQRTVAELQTKTEAITEQYNDAQDKLAASRKRQAVLAAKEAGLRSRVSTSRDTVARLAVEAYQGGNMSMLASVMTSGSPQTFLDQIATLDVLSSSQRSTIDGLVDAKTALAADRARLARETKAQETQLAVVSARKTQILASLAQWQQLESRYGLARASRGSARDTSVAFRPVPVSGSAGVAVRFALAQRGKPYRWGAAGPNSYDCSGLTMASWARAGVSMPHTAHGQYASFPHVSLSALMPGDLVFYSGHVAMYVGSGMVVHAPTTGDVVKVVPISRAGSGLYGAARPS
jgi:cell wall-associated NlpC family hydrolase